MPDSENEIPKEFRDLLDAPIAILATIGTSGRPQLSPVWFLAEDKQLVISLNSARQKTKNLQRNPECTLLIVDPSGYRYVEVRADAELVPDADYEFADRVGAKYDNANLREMDQPGEARVKVILHPARVRAVDMSGA